MQDKQDITGSLMLYKRKININVIVPCNKMDASNNGTLAGIIVDEYFI